MNWDLLNENWDNINGWTPYGSETAEISPAGQLHLLSEEWGGLYRYVPTPDFPEEGYTVEWREYYNIIYDYGDGYIHSVNDNIHYIAIMVSADKVKILNTTGGRDFFLLSSVIGAWYTWRILVDSVNHSFKIYRNNVFVGEFADAYPFADDGWVDTVVSGEIGYPLEKHEDYFRIASGLHIPEPRDKGLIGCSSRYDRLGNILSRHNTKNIDPD